MNDSILYEDNIIFGLIFTIGGGYFFLKNIKNLIDELDDKEYGYASNSINVMVGGGIIMIIGIILLFF